MRRTGIALPLAVLALWVMAALTAAAFFAVLQDHRMSMNGVKLEQALAAAESGAAIVLASWGDAEGGLALGDSIRSVGWLPRGGGWYRVEVRRTGARLFLIKSTGFSADSLARQRIGLLVRVRAPGDGGGAERLSAHSWLYLF